MSPCVCCVDGRATGGPAHSGRRPVRTRRFCGRKREARRALTVPSVCENMHVRMQRYSAHAALCRERWCVRRTRSGSVLASADRSGTIHLHQTTTVDARAVPRGAHRLRAGPLEAALATARTTTSKCITVARLTPTSREGSGGIWERLHYDWSDRQPRRHEDHRLATSGAVARATSTPSRGGPTERPMWTPSWYARARTSKDGCSALVLGTVGKGVLEKAFQRTPSRPSKRGTGQQVEGSIQIRAT